MRRFIVTAMATLLLASCNEPKVEVEPEGYRQYAEQWCTEFEQLKAECSSPSSYAEQRIAECVARQDWDWTNSCGAMMWDGRQCVISHGCSVIPWDETYQEQCERDAQGGCIHPCQEHFTALHRSCPQGIDENGLPYGSL